MLKRIIFSFVLISIIFNKVNSAPFEVKNNSAVNLNDTFIALKATSSPLIDGIASEDFWANATWYPLDQIWLPYNDNVEADDFTGRFKLSWTDERLLLLVEVTDDSLYDRYTNPTDNYWNDDCVEVFLDEDKSGGNHLNTFNAFAYHLSTKYDVIDNGISGAAMFNDHIEAKWIKNSEDKYTWELSIKIFDDTYVQTGTNEPVTLTANKVMGFSLAYCDNDASVTRENFIGSKYLPQNQSNNSYIDASIFGKLFLIDPSVSSLPEESEKMVSFFPNPSKGVLNYSIENTIPDGTFLNIYTFSGSLITSYEMDSEKENGTIDIDGLKNGIYLIEIKNKSTVLSTGKLSFLR